MAAMTMDEPFFQYGQAECQALAAADPVLGAAMDRIGHVWRAADADLFAELVRAFVGQQISTKAQKTIFARMEARLGALTPESLLRLSVEEIQAFGMSLRKAGYIRATAAQVASGELDLMALHTMTDEQVCERLVRLRGIGRWTAEMLMLFSMQRPNILSYDDLGIRRGLRMLYGLESIDKAFFEACRVRYTPYGSVASLYLWEISRGAIPELADMAPPKPGKER